MVSKVWHIEDVVPSGGTYVIDLFDLTRQAFNTEISDNLSGVRVKTIIITNPTTGVAGEIRVHANTGSGFTYPFGGATGIPVAVGSPLILSNTQAGYLPVDTTHRYIHINDSGLGLNFKIAIVG